MSLIGFAEESHGHWSTFGINSCEQRVIVEKYKPVYERLLETPQGMWSEGFLFSANLLQANSVLTAVI